LPSLPVVLAALLLAVSRVSAAPALPAVPLATEEKVWDERPIRLPPLFWLEREKDRRFLMASLLYWDWREGVSSQQLLLPVFYRSREADRSLLVSLPFIASYRRAEESWTVAGPFFRSANERFTRTALFPLYWQQSRPRGGRVTAALPFLFYDYRSFDRSKIDQAWLLGWRRVRGTATRGIFLNYAWSRDPDEGFQTFFPLYWRRHSPDAATDVVGPFYRRVEEKSDGQRRYAGLFPLAGWGGGGPASNVRSHYLFPLYYYGRTSDRTFWMTPLASREAGGDRRRGHAGLFYYDRDPDQKAAGLFPLWYRSASADGFSKTVQALNFYDRREGDERFQTLFPLYGRWTTSQGSRFLSWGVWRRRTELLNADGGSAGSRVSGWALLAHWSGDAKGNRTRVLFPLVWDYRRPPDWGLDLVFPFYAHYRDGPLSLTATPFFIHARNEGRESWSWLFLYWKNDLINRRTHLFFPLLYHEAGPRRTLWLTPLYWSRRSPLSREGAFPLGYWYASREKARTFLLPFYGHNRTLEGRWSFVGPAYRAEGPDRRSYGVLPLWGRFFSSRERGSYLAPFYWASGDGRGNGSMVLPPLLAYVSQRRAGTPERERSVNYLLLGTVAQKGADLSHGFFPLYQYAREGDFRNFWAPRILPLIAWERRARVRQGYVFPYAFRRSPEADWNFFFPLWYSGRRFSVEGGSAPVRGPQSSTARVLFPVYWHAADGARTHTYAPPFFVRFDEGPRRVRAVTPLGWSVDTAGGGKFRLFFPLYWRVVTAPRPDAPSKDISVVGPWYRVKTERDGRPSRTMGLAPFFSSTAAGPRDRYFDILGGLYARDVRDGMVRHRFLYFFTTSSAAKPLPAAQEILK